MKFIRYREKQSDWFGKRGLSWHISTVITKNAGTGKVELKSYAHIFDSCQQDWYAVCSIIENTLEMLGNELALLSCSMTFPSHSMEKMCAIESFAQ